MNIKSWDLNEFHHPPHTRPPAEPALAADAPGDDDGPLTALRGHDFSHSKNRIDEHLGQFKLKKLGSVRYVQGISVDIFLLVKLSEMHADQGQSGCISQNVLIIQIKSMIPKFFIKRKIFFISMGPKLLVDPQ